MRRLLRELANGYTHRMAGSTIVTKQRRLALVALLAGSIVATPGCGNVDGLNARDPARGPGQLVGNGSPVSDGEFAGGADEMPAAREVVRVPEEGFAIDCGPGCREYCEDLGLENPVNAGICPSLWGVGLSSQPVDRIEACRRLHADMLGRYPTPAEVESTCDQATWGDVVKTLLDSDEFVLVNQRRWADILLYNNRAVNFERAWDMDDLVGKAYEGRVSWDEFAAVTSAHPVMIRRRDTAGDRAAFVFETFLGRPPYENERSDLARLYRLWTNGYWDHPHVGVVPDAFIDFRCVDSEGNPDTETIGECTSILFGKHTLTLSPDVKRLVRDDEEQEGTMWAGFLKPEEWKALQMPGRLVAQQPAFWEHAAEEVLKQYLGYDIASAAPEVMHELVKYVLAYNGDIRALHFAVATSLPYLQTTRGSSTTTFPWTYGPLKQIAVEGWVDTIAATTGTKLSQCDHRLPHPEDYVGDDTLEEVSRGWAHALVKFSRWDVTDDREVETDYRNLTRTLGGCPTNEAGGRFTTVSVLNTAVQEAFVAEVCGIGDPGGADIERLLPDGMSSAKVLDGATAEAVLTYQQRMWMGRWPTDEELAEVRAVADNCGQTCDAGSFARPLCFSLLSGAEMLFY